ncbi:hypothetical protein Tcan_16971 [Toxocara canis]|uniref:Uncharacterized protein n=1 Tax=Toxocara canis TaxID=6265 RepID=A0A0B2VF68_TOXCA|nr:hypothetical protein Tcan_16971 [Toxocara canis]
MIELLAQLTAAYMGTFMTVMLASYAPILIIAQCAKKTPEPHGVYKPGHLPTFVDPESKEADTYYSMKSEVAFPKKDKDGNVIPEGKVEEESPKQQPHDAKPTDEVAPAQAKKNT